MLTLTEKGRELARKYFPQKKLFWIIIAITGTSPNELRQRGRGLIHRLPPRLASHRRLRLGHEDRDADATDFDLLAGMQQMGAEIGSPCERKPH